jgi:pimeloyl-ACP methyl ester carboxylesterase
MIVEDIIVGQGTDYPLKGKLTLPEAEHTVPAVVFIHGSGSSNMDEAIGKVTPFRDLAEGLAGHGIASIRYDKRSFAHGFKMVQSKTPITVREEVIEDALLATELLRQDSRINTNKIFIAGHSMGGMLAPRIDAEGGNYAGLVLLAGSPRNLEVIMMEQLREVADGTPRFLRWIVEKQAKKIEAGFRGLYEISDDEAKTRNMGGGTTAYYFKEMGQHPPALYLKKHQKPILVMQGEKDVQVKADRDFAAYREILKHNPNATFRLYPGLNHAFVPALYGTMAKAAKEFSKEQHIGANVIADLANWILAQ